jgi:transcription termination factor Rho
VNEAAGTSQDRPDTWEGPHVTDTTDTPSSGSSGSETATETGAGRATRQRRASGLSGMLLPELKQMAGGLGIKGVGAMRKSQLVDAIKAAQSRIQSGSSTESSPSSSSASSGNGRGASADGPPQLNDGASTRLDTRSTGRNGSRPSGSDETLRDVTARSSTGDLAGAREARSDQDLTVDQPGHESGHQLGEQDAGRPDVRSGRAPSPTRDDGDRAAASSREPADDRGRADRSRAGGRTQAGDRTQADRTQADRTQADRTQADRTQADRGPDRSQNDRTQNDRTQADRTQADRTQADRTQNDRTQNDRTQNDEDGSRRNRRRRGRDRNDRNDRPDRNDRNDRGTPRTRSEPDTTVLEDDILVPAAGILDVLDNYAFVRTSGYLPGSEDVYVSLSMVRKLGLRRGDAVTGQVRQPREGDRKEKFNPLVRIDTVNGADPETARNRVDFQKLTPLYASERLRLETDSNNLIGRVIDIAAPIGKGQRGLIVSPSKAGKTMIMQSIANSITTNNPECHLMVVLVDERPEEVTDFERSVKGEVISSTFDRPASDHTAVAELAIERAKRLVELGHDVVVLLDGITRLGRAYNLAAPASGRILSGGVDSAALYPPKRFFGAARNIEDGGSLTILATALIESGSKMDEVIFEEFKGTGNMEIRLRRDFADKRIFPAIDAVQSGTRREELLMSKEELSIVWKLRRVLSGLDSQQALELLLERLRKSSSNIEFLTQVQKTTPTVDNGRNGG